jgi:hypothetical protein
MIKYVYCIRKRADLTRRRISHLLERKPCDIYSGAGESAEGEEVYSEPQDGYPAQ